MNPVDTQMNPNDTQWTQMYPNEPNDIQVNSNDTL